MTSSVPETRSAVPSDLDELVRIDSAGWPAALAAGRPQIASRLAIYPQGQIVAVIEGRIAGAIATQRTTAAWFHTQPLTYDRLTDAGSIAASHHGDGEIFHLIGVAVDPTCRGGGLGRLLVNAAIRSARSLAGIQRILGYTRPVGLRRRPDLSIEEYLEHRDEQGRPLDPVVAMHVGNGARIVSIQPAFRPDDVETRGYGILIEYAVQ